MPVPTPQYATLGTARLIDSHCHLYSADYPTGIPALLDEARRMGITRAICVGTDYTSSVESVDLAHTHAGIFAAVGLHPHEAERAREQDWERFAELVRRERKGAGKIVAYGEIGLDYALMRASMDAQQRAFARQLAMAKALDLPVIIHDRDAHADTARLIRAASPLPRGGVLHCFSGDLALAREMIDLGFLISFSGVITFKNAEPLQEVARALDPAHILVETDSPYLTPVPHRGKRNQPAYVFHTAQKVAEIKNMSLEELAHITWANTCSLFNLPLEDRP